MRHLISANELSQEILTELFKRADEIRENGKQYADRLKGKIIATLFFEPSTRTRLSFDSAVMRLGGDVLSTENANGNSSATKGESLLDTIRIVENYADAIIIRHPDNHSSSEAARISTVPIINAGSGNKEHPTQSLLDVYTIYKRFGKIDGLKIALFGDLKFGRTAHSLMELLNQYQNVEVYCLAAGDLKLPEEEYNSHVLPNITFHECTTISEVPKEINVIYQTRIQKERNDGIACEPIRIDKKILDQFSNEVILLHPLPRNDEISPELDDDKRAMYFEQAKNGLYVRMALLTKIFE